MKKLILLFVIVLTVFACSKNDDSPVNQEDPIVGTWKFYKYLENGIEQELEACEIETTIIFNRDGSFSSEVFNEISGNCESVVMTTGTWTSTANKNYTIIIGGDPETEMFTFIENTFYTESIDDNETPNDNSDDVLTREVFIKQ